MGVVSTSPEMDKSWHIGRSLFRGLMKDAIRLHKDDPEVVDVFESGMALLTKSTRTGEAQDE